MAQNPMMPGQPGQRPPQVPPNGGGRANTPQQGALPQMGMRPQRPQGPQPQAPQGGPQGGQVPGQVPGQQPPPPSMQPSQAGPPEQIPAQEGISDTEKLRIEALLSQTNIADRFNDEELSGLAAPLHASIEKDAASMDDWLKRMNEYLDLAMQIKKAKTFPWRNAANIKFPLLTIAAMQFHARAMPAIVNRKSVVKGKPIGYDPSGSKAERAERIGKHMTYQLVDQSETWEDDMDKLTLILGICGSVFKEVAWNTLDDIPDIDLVLPQDMIVNYWAKSMDDARRITRRHYFYKNSIIEKQREGVFREFDLPEPKFMSKTPEEDKRSGKRNIPTDNVCEDIPYEVWKTQCYLDLDEDDYKEPYLVWMLAQDKSILRIEPAFDVRSIKKNAKGKIQRIIPRKRFVKYDFIPSPDGGLLGVGFGLLLASLNESVNTSLNQLTDQGTMHSTNGGFIAKGIRMRAGKLEFEPNEWKVVQITGDDLKKNIVPLPVKEPSKVLLEMTQLLLAGGKEIVSINEMGTGKLPGQNTPATTTMSAVEEGMKLFNAIYQRIWRAMKREFKILFALNRGHITDEQYFTVLDGSGNPFGSAKISADDYNSDDADVMPESDPNIASDALRLAKAQQLMELIPLRAVDPGAAGQRILAALDQPNTQELAPKPQPDPKVQAMQMKAENDKAKTQADIQAKQQIAQIQAEYAQKEAELKLQVKQKELEIKEMQLQLRARELQMEMQFAQQNHQLESQINTERHGQKLQENDQLHQQKIQQSKEKVKPDGKSGQNRSS